MLVHKAPNALTMRNKVEHLRRRRIMGQGFSDSALRTFEVDVRHFIGILRDQINKAMPSAINGADQAWSTAMDMSHWC